MTEENSDRQSIINRLIDPIDRTPDNWPLVVGFGNETMTQFGVVGDDVCDLFDRIGNKIEAIDNAYGASSKTDAKKKAAENMLAQFNGEAQMKKAALEKVIDDFRVYLDAAKEILKRYDENYIPEARKRSLASQDPKAQKYLDDVILRKADFNRQASVLERSCVNTFALTRQLDQIFSFAPKKGQ